jgi:uncharacterized membrane protein (UPF0127 family)
MYSLFGVLTVAFFGLGAYVYQEQQAKVSVDTLPSLAGTTTQIAAVGKEESQTLEDTWQSIYPVVVPMTIGNVEVLASVAQSWPDRIKGLSDTPYIPEQVVKLFVFDSPGFHSIWMKDMNYAIDIIWVDDAQKVVHVEKGAAPESYPAMFVPEIPAKYVIETAAGFVEKNTITVGSAVVLPKL